METSQRRQAALFQGIIQINFEFEETKHNPTPDHYI